MNNFDWLHNAVAVEKKKHFDKMPIKTLGETILMLEAQPSDNLIKIDFTTGNPNGVGSYRGYYEDLAIHYDNQKPPINVKVLLRWLRNAVGGIFSGYKGGDFTMNTKTIVWVAEYGSTGKMLCGIKKVGKNTILLTQVDEDY